MRHHDVESVRCPALEDRDQDLAVGLQRHLTGVIRLVVQDVGDDDAEYNRPRSNAKVGLANQKCLLAAAAVRRSNLVVSVGMG